MIQAGRVRYTIEFQDNRYSGYRPKPGSGELTIDGRVVPLPRDYTHLGRIFADPDSGIPVPDGEATPPVPPAPADLHVAPIVVRTCYEIFAKALTRRGIEDPRGLLSVGRAGPRWIITISVNDTTGMALNFSRNKRGKWEFDRHEPLRLIRDGTDLTDRAHGDITRAIQLLTGGKPASETTPRNTHAPNTSRPAPTTMSTQARKTTIIRV